MENGEAALRPCDQIAVFAAKPNRHGSGRARDRCMADISQAFCQPVATGAARKSGLTEKNELQSGAE